MFVMNYVLSTAIMLALQNAMISANVILDMDITTFMNSSFGLCGGIPCRHRNGKANELGVLRVCVRHLWTGSFDEKCIVQRKFSFLTAPPLEQNSTSVTEEIHGKNLSPKTYGIHLEIPGALQPLDIRLLFYYQVNEKIPLHLVTGYHVTTKKDKKGNTELLLINKTKRDFEPERKLNFYGETRLMCSKGYYGSDCNTYCDSKENATYYCNKNGEKICIPGINGIFCDSNLFEEGSLGPDNEEADEKEEEEEGIRRIRRETVLNPCHSAPCKNGAHCNWIGQLNFTCTCQMGYTGNLCDYGIDDCIGDPCLNGGTCIDNIGYYNCTCIFGYTGTLCETDIQECASFPCMNGGTCKEPDVGFYKCICPWGFVGRRCQIEEDACAILSPCLNGGTCQPGSLRNYTCLCPEGFTGKECEKDIDECETNPCLNGGICAQGRPGNFYCICPFGYNGTLCQEDINECLSNPCVHGKCKNEEVGAYTCSCDYGIIGKNCNETIDVCLSHPCLNGGHCLSASPGRFNCSCSQGFEGERCEIDHNECEDNQCLNGGTCHEGKPGQFVCECLPGFNGTLCGVDINECASHPCHNNGQCHEGPPSVFFVSVSLGLKDQHVRGRLIIVHPGHVNIMVSV